MSVTILLCGTSGCGKSTLSALLVSRLGITAVEDKIVEAEARETVDGKAVMKDDEKQHQSSSPSRNYGWGYGKHA